MVRVHKARINILACGINDLRVIGGEFAPHCFYAAAADEYITIVKNAVLLIAGHNSIGIPNQYFLP